MKKQFFLFLLVVHVFYIAHALFDFGLRMSMEWNILLGFIFITSLFYSSIHLLRSKKHPLLSVSVLSLSLASLGWFTFINFLSIVMG
ncbi:hypothetical protein ACJA3J_08575 [Halobacillus sp. SY10]|uniref:Uncharacterized protein n=2 Tax=Halobacillus TaxID=45667 RepID=A0A1H0GEG3_HALAD|nr:MULTISPECIES: hypothetical protein [Halobacillus]RDY72648.1 hypothetical protein DXT76_00710 [Halobacillus trueperi]SDO05263.1 hypothetical protein SAMN05421677_102299 [Halobacillus aidingensis]